MPKRRRSQKVLQPEKKSKQQRPRTVDDTIESVASGRASILSNDEPNSSSDGDIDIDTERSQEIEQLRLDIKSMNEKIQQQNEIIATMNTQLDFVLSLLGVCDGSVPGNTSTTTTASQATIVPHPSKATDSNSIDPTGNWPSLPAPVGSLGQQLNRGKRGGGDRDRGSTMHKMASSFRDTVADVIHREQQAVKNKAKNFIVSGLPISQAVSDEQRAAEICQRDLDITLDIRFCRRLGKENAERDQKLLVVTADSGQASLVISTARLLRKSPELVVKHQVYINPDHTKAEARAAYESRQRRRQDKQAGVWYPSQTAVGRPADDPCSRFDFDASASWPGNTTQGAGCHPAANFTPSALRTFSSTSTSVTGGSNNCAIQTTCDGALPTSLASSSGAGCGDAIHRPSTGGVDDPAVGGSARPGPRTSGVAAAPATEQAGPSAVRSATTSTISTTPMSDYVGSDSTRSGLDVNAPTFVQLQPSESTSSAAMPMA